MILINFLFVAEFLLGIISAFSNVSFWLPLSNVGLMFVLAVLDINIK